MRLFRFTHADGSAKEWAWCQHSDGTVEVRWGRAGRLVQSETYLASRLAEVQRRERDKTRKGYVYQGQAMIAADGRPVPVGSGAARPRHIDRPTTASPIDLSRIETGGEDYWF
jgi:predicted DNA-binding WGR domain protein